MQDKVPPAKWDDVRAVLDAEIRLNIVVESRSFAAEQTSERLTPESVQRTLTEELQAVLPMLRRLPRRIDRITGAMEQSRLSMSMRLFADERDRSFLTGLLHQVMLTALGCTR
ncbi:hypothetical protein [Lentzea sp. NPDC051838]|uniref:hypothetical protein n=1 Tax=Lentzea sp. NPDC051838 TaxID=3154849 RepID=UPI00343EBC0C